MSKEQNSLTIAQIIPSLNSGGVERGVVDVSLFLQKNNHNPIVISSGGSMIQQLKAKNITFIKLDVKTKNPLKILLNIKKLKKIIGQHKIDIVHVRSRAPMWSAYFACKSLKIKLVSTVHGTYSTKFLCWDNFALKNLYNNMMLRADFVIAVSHHIKNYISQYYPKYYKKFNKNNFKVIARGADIGYFNLEKITQKRIINLKKEWQIQDNKKRIIFMPARFTEWKGHEFLIDSLAKVKEDFLCIMAGSDHGHEDYKKRLEQRIKKLNLSSKIKIVQNCHDMAAAYAASTFVISPSLRPEAFGRIPIEAQSCNKTVIATNIGGFCETIIENKTGFLVKPNDCDEMSKKIRELLLLEQEKLENIGQEARINITQNFSNNLMLRKTLESYQEAIT